MNVCEEMVEQFFRLTKGVQKEMWKLFKTHAQTFPDVLPRKEALRIAEQLGFHPKRKKACYYNAQMLAMLDEKRIFHYYEGYALPKGLIPLEHAWIAMETKTTFCVVVDLTWKDAEAYYGVEIPLGFVRKNIFDTKEAQQLLYKYLQSKLERGEEK